MLPELSLVPCLVSMVMNQNAMGEGFIMKRRSKREDELDRQRRENGSAARGLNRLKIPVRHLMQADLS